MTSEASSHHAVVERLVPTDRSWVVQAGIAAAQHLYRPPVDAIDRFIDPHPDIPEIDWWEGGEGYFSKAMTSAAFDLLQNSRIFGLGTGTEDAFTDAVRWLAETAEQYGFLNGGSPTRVPPDPNYDDQDPENVLPSMPVGGWPDGRHLRLHYLADIGRGWYCRDCGVGLIDICRDADIITDASGRRLIDPKSSKRLPTRDHRIPQSMNGSDGPENLDLVCRPCNSRKGAS